MRPDDQLDLTERELKEEITRILTANNPHAPENIVRFSFSERGFVKQPQVDQMAILFTLGTIIFEDKDMDRIQSRKTQETFQYDKYDDTLRRMEIRTLTWISIFSPMNSFCKFIQ